ncbi:hypothetical protein [Nocardioides sp. W7]|uniref:hypothetical protein n=1 Tax=Nocardioides sp. W7 TaxID=2931390 RepID=UPI001FD42C23|nr:hypothetical protein [Nocardioides sp. W7]
MTRRLLTLALGAALLVGGGPVTALPASAADPIPTSTETELAATPATTTPGGSVTLSAEVASTATGVPAGKVTFHAAGDTDLSDDVDVQLASGVPSANAVTVTTSVTAPAAAGDHEYLATFVPADPTLWVGSSKTVTVGVRRAADVTLTADATSVIAREDLTLTATVDSGGNGVPTGSVLVLRDGDTGPGQRFDLDDADHGTDSATFTATVRPPVAGPVTYTATYEPATGSPLLTDQASVGATVTARAYTPAFSFDPGPAVVGATSTVTVSATDDEDQSAVEADPAATTLTVGGAPVVLSLVGGELTGSYQPTQPGDPAVALSFAPASGAYAVESATGTVAVRRGTTTTLSSPTSSPRVEDQLTFTATVSTSGHGVPTGTVRLMRVVDPAPPGGPLTETVVASALLSANTAPGAHSDAVTITIPTTDTDVSDYVARYLPDSTAAATFVGSDSAPASRINPVLRSVDLSVAVAATLPTVGALTTVTVTAEDRDNGQPVAPTSSTLTIGGDTVPLTWGTGAAKGTATGPWTPSAGGQRAVALGFRPAGASYDTATTLTPTIAAVRVADRTTTVLDVPANPLIGDPVTLTATVRAREGSVTPTGQVSFTANGGSPVLRSLVASDTDGEATAEYTFTPGSNAALAFAAAYVPATGPQLHASSSIPSAPATTLTPRKRILEVDVASADHLVNTDKVVTVTVRDKDDHDRAFTIASGSLTPGGTAARAIAWAGKVGTATYRPGTVGTKALLASVVPGDTTVYESPATGSGSLVVKANQNPTASVPSGIHRAGSTATVTVANSFGAVTITPKAADGTTYCSVNGSVVTLTRGPTCTVTVVAAGDATHFDKTFDLPITVTPRPVDVTVTVTPVKSPYGTRVRVSAKAVETGSSTALGGTGQVFLHTDNPAAKVLAGDYEYGGPDLVISDVGDLLDADAYVATVTYVPPTALTGVLGTTQDTAAFTVDQTTQEVAFRDPTASYVDEVWEDVAGNTTVSSASVNLSVVTPVGTPAGQEVCRVENATDVKFLRPGSCTVRAVAPASNNYLERTVSETVTVARRPLLVSTAATNVTTSGDSPRYGDDLLVRVTLTDQLSSSSTVPVNGVGTIRIGGYDDPSAVLVTGRFTNGVADRPFRATAIGTHRVSVTFTPDAVGGVDRFRPVVATDPVLPQATFTVERGFQRILWHGQRGDLTAFQDSAYVDEPWDPQVTGGPSGEPVVLTPVNTAVCKVVAGKVVVVRAVAAETCQVTATQDGGDFHHDADVSRAVLTTRLRPVTAVIGVPAVPTYNQPAELTVTATDTRLPGPVPNAPVPGSNPVVQRSGTGELTVWLGGTLAKTLPLTYVAGVATTAGFTPPEAKTYTLRATFVPTRVQVYDVAAIPDVPLVVQVAPQVIRLADPPEDPNVDTTWDPAPQRGASGNPVTMVVTTPDVCEKVRPAGTPIPTPDLEVLPVRFTKVSQNCELTFGQAGNEFYAAADPTPRTILVERRKVDLKVTGPGDSLNFESRIEIDLAATARRAPNALVPGSTEVMVTDLTVPGTPTAPSSVGELTVDEVNGTAELVFPEKTLKAGTYSVTFTFQPGDQTNWEPKTAAPVTFTVALATQTVELIGNVPTLNQVSKKWTPPFKRPSSLGTVMLSAGDVTHPTWLSDYTRISEETRPTTTCATKDTAHTPQVPEPDTIHDTVVFQADGPCEVLAELPAIEREYSASPVVRLDLTVTRIPTTIEPGVPTKGSADPAWPTVDEDILVTAIARGDGRFGVGAGTFALSRAGQPLPGFTGESQEWFGGGNFASFRAELAGDYRLTATFLPTDPVTFSGATEVRDFKIEEAKQPITPAEQPPTSRKVRKDWTTTVTGGASSNPVRLVVDNSATTGLDPVSLPPGVPPYACHAEGLVLKFEGKGTCTFSYVQAAVPDKYREGRSPAYAIDVQQTDTDLVIEPPASLEVGKRATVVVRASAGGSPVPGTGAIDLRDQDGAISLSTPGGTWVNGVGTYVFTPRVAGGGLRIAVDFTPADLQAFTRRSSTVPVSVWAGTPVIALATDQVPGAWVGDAWTPGATATSGGTVAIKVTPADGPCTRVGSTVEFRSAGDCTVALTLAEDKGTDDIVDWTAAEAVEREITVSRHPVEVDVDVVIPPATGLRYAEDISVSARVVGRPRNSTAVARVKGMLTFLVDGAEVPGVAPVEVADDGSAAATIRVLRGPVVDGVDPDQHTIGARFTPATDYLNAWASPTVQATYRVARTVESVVADLNPPPDGLVVGQTWAPQVSTASGRPVTVSAGPATICSSDDDKVTIDGYTGSTTACEVSYTVAGDDVYAPIAPFVGIRLQPSLRPVTVVPTAEQTVIGEPVRVTAQVSAPAYTPPAAETHTTGLARAVPSGTVTFEVSGTPVVTQTVAVDAAGRAVFTGYRPDTAEPRTVTATFEPDPSGPRTYASFTDSVALPIGRIGTEARVQSVTPTEIRAAVTRLGTPASTLGGTVTFSWTAPDGSGAVQVLGSAPVLGGVARLASLPPPTQDALITARYSGDRDHDLSFGRYRRALPTLTATANRSVSGWQTKPVRITFACAWPSPAVAGDCPDPVDLTTDQRDRTVSATVTTTDGGTASAAVTDINIDQTAPTIGLTGVTGGRRYLSTMPDVGCRTSDQTSGSTCRVRLSPAVDEDDLYAGEVTATARATDAAGNTSTTTTSFQVLQAWVTGAPDVSGGFQVKRRAKLKIAARTEGAQPQLMLPRAKGKLFPGPVFRAVRVNEGIVSWVATVKVPARYRAGDRWTVGYRLSDAKRTVVRLRVDVVRRPSARTR